MLIAQDENKLVEANHANRTNQYVCPGCQQKVVLKRGLQKISHFAHRRGGCQTASENESQIHLAGKIALKKILAVSKQPVQLERYFISIKQRADLCLTKQQIIVEYQCSPISLQRLQQRHNGYKMVNYQVYWILGNPYLKHRIDDSLVSKFGRYHSKLGFYILYYDSMANRFILRHSIVEKTGKYYWQQSVFKSLQEWQKLIKDWQPNYLTTIPLNQQVQQLKRMQQQIVRGQINCKELLTTCYLARKNLIGCPWICHCKSTQIPIYGKKSLQWRIWLLIQLFDSPRSNLKITDLKAIYNQLISKYALDFVQIEVIPDFQRILFWNYIKELAQFGYLRLFYDKLIIIRKPVWYPDLEHKLGCEKEYLK